MNFNWLILLTLIVFCSSSGRSAPLKSTWPGLSQRILVQRLINQKGPDEQMIQGQVSPHPPALSFPDEELEMGLVSAYLGVAPRFSSIPAMQICFKLVLRPQHVLRCSIKTSSEVFKIPIQSQQDLLGDSIR